LTYRCGCNLIFERPEKETVWCDPFEVSVGSALSTGDCIIGRLLGGREQQRVRT